WMPYVRARKGIHEGMGMWTGVRAASASAMDALCTCAHGIHAGMGMGTRDRHDQIPCCVSGMRPASGHSPLDALNIHAHKGIQERMGMLQGSLRRQRVLPGCPEGLRARASMRAWACGREVCVASAPSMDAL